MSDKEPISERYRYELEDWIGKLQSMPVEEIDSYDESQSYEFAAGHLFKLENGKYAFVYESGCSCYDPSWAEISIFENIVDAKEKFLERKVQDEKYNS